MPEKFQLHRPSHVRLVDDVRQTLERAILSGAMRPGERLAESRIAQELGVSRTTVREALLMLENRRLVVSVPRRGTFVSRLSTQDALDLSYLRALLEGFAVSIGHARIDSQMLSGLEAQVEKMRRCRLPDETPDLIEIDLAFHTPLVQSAASPRLEALWSSLSGQIGALILRAIETYQASAEDIAQAHERLLAALRTADPQQMLEGVVAHYVGRARFEQGIGQGVVQMARLMATLYTGADGRLANGQDPSVVPQSLFV
jgi:DNA-binding GntR family transcriptional regulator